ncbi:hypothetical protein PHYBOEH_006786 [Phytophthora boehmeriae]|uniref:RxLR effector protein n=1 Tax=Phytophthora boehmeriae TaxID=109152 RepID=A0A8T1WHP1_9STRA|nr:hypothetical protein PHYBOEH_006786 [Phytophthora boehmeriae]
MRHFNLLMLTMALLIVLCNGSTTAPTDSPTTGNTGEAGKRFLRTNGNALVEDGDDDEERLFGLGKLKSKFSSWRTKRSIAKVTKKVEKATKKEAKMIDDLIKRGKNPETIKAQLKVVDGVKSKYSGFVEKFTNEYNKLKRAIAPV